MPKTKENKDINKELSDIFQEGLKTYPEAHQKATERTKKEFNHIVKSYTKQQNINPNINKTCIDCINECKENLIYEIVCPSKRTKDG